MHILRFVQHFRYYFQRHRVFSGRISTQEYMQLRINLALIYTGLEISYVRTAELPVHYPIGRAPTCTGPVWLAHIGRRRA
jgi:hypothetical protein